MAVIVSAATSFFLTPYVLHHLGDELYGLWVLVVALTDYYVFLQVGIRSAIVRYVSRNLALHDMDAVNRVVASSFYFYLAILMLVSSAALAFSQQITHFFSVKPAYVLPFAALFALMGIAQGFDFPLNVFEGCLEAVGRFDQLYAFRITGLIVRVILIIVVLQNGGGLFAVGATTILSTLMVRFLAVPAAFREVKGLSLHPRSIDKKTFKEMLGYGLTSFTVGIGERLKISLYPVVIAKFLSASAVTMFALPSKLLSVPLSGLGMMTEFVNPLSSKLEAQQDETALRRVLILCGESIFLLVCPFAVLMFVFGKQIISLWVGTGYASTYALLVLLTIGVGMSTTQASTQSLLFGIGRHKGLVWIRLLEGIGIAVLGIVLMKPWGLWGYAFSTMVVSLSINLLLIPAYACRVLRMPLYVYLKSGCLKPSIYSAPLVLSLLMLKYSFSVQSWLILIAVATVGAAVYLGTLLAGALAKRTSQISWWSLSVLDLLKQRFIDGKKDIEIAGGSDLVGEFGPAAEQSLAE